MPCRTVLQTFPLRFNGLQRHAASPCDMHETNAGVPVAEIKTWGIRLKRAGKAERVALPEAHGTSVPDHGMIIEVQVGGESVRARVVHVQEPPRGFQGIFTVDVDEIADRYLVKYSIGLDDGPIEPFSREQEALSRIRELFLEHAGNLHIELYLNTLHAPYLGFRRLSQWNAGRLALL